MIYVAKNLLSLHGRLKINKALFCQLSATKLTILTQFCTLFLLLLIPIKTVSATRLNLADLGQYNFTYDKVETVDHVAGNHVLSQVTEKKGENFSVFLPFSVQQVNYMVANGQNITKNQPIAYLTGYDVHHFLDEFEAAKQLFNSAEQQYKSSKHLYENKALKQSQWLESSQLYFAAKLRFEHLHHYMSFLYIDKQEKVSIIAPVDGVLRYARGSSAKEEGELLFDIIPNQAIRLKISVPLTNLEHLAHIEVINQNCKLSIDNKEQVVNQFSVTIWSESFNNNCQLSLGQHIVVTPVYDQKAYVIKKSAIFEFKNKNYVAVKAPKALNLVEINLLSSTEDRYFFSSTELLTDQEILVTSVSAIQGVLLELGGE
jgi:hypothetical protein